MLDRSSDSRLHIFSQAVKAINTLNSGKEAFLETVLETYGLLEL